MRAHYVSMEGVRGEFAFITPAVKPPEASPLKVAAFSRMYVNRTEVSSVRIHATSLGCFELFVNGRLVSVSDDDGRTDFLRPGFTDVRKRRHCFSYDVTDMWKCGSGEANDVSSFVARSWFSDGIGGRKKDPAAFAAKIELVFKDGTTCFFDTGADWNASYDTPYLRAGIWEGEKFDASVPLCAKTCAGDGKAVACKVFNGVVVPSVRQAQVRLREDLLLAPVEMYVWSGVDGAEGKVRFGKVRKIRAYSDGEEIKISKGEKLVVDFGQNASAIPVFTASAAKGTSMWLKAAEMLNDSAGERSRGNDGPAGSIYRANYRSIKGISLLYYTFRGDREESYRPSFTFQGYRYLQIEADGDVTIRSIRSLPVTSVARADERGTIVTGDPDVNKLISNIVWGMYSNYLSVPTDCPQRDERFGWSADTQVFAGTAYFIADVYDFHRKWMQDMRDAQKNGMYPSVAPYGGYGDCGVGKLGWADAGIIVPWTAWRMTGRTGIIKENFDSMAAYLAAQDGKNGNMSPNENYSDWLSYEDVGNVSGCSAAERPALRRKYWEYLSACYWLQNCRMMVDMCKAIGKDPSKYVAMGAKARAYLKSLDFVFNSDGVMIAPFSKMQTPQLFAYHLGLYDDSKKGATSAANMLNRNFRMNLNCLQTGFLGTSIIMNALTYPFQRPDMAYTLLQQRENPSWLYSVDNGATTVWERWNSYTLEKGFGSASMNSFNHYAYGAVLQWMYETMAGIQPGAKGGFDSEFVLAPIPDSRIGSVRAAYRTSKGLIKSSWHYEGSKCIFSFTIPEGSTAQVRFCNVDKVFKSGDYVLEGIP